MRRAALLFLFAAVAGAHEAVQLHCPESIAYRVVRDFDGDGLAELAVFTRKEAWIWHGRRDGWPADPNVKLPLPEGTAFFDVTDAGGKELEVVIRTADAYWAIDRAGTRRKLEVASGPGLPARPNNVLWRGLYYDLDGDGKRDSLDISLRGYAITYGSGESVLLPPRLAEIADTDVGAASERMLARFALAGWTSGRFGGDARRDFAVMTKTGLLVYPADKNGRVDAERSRVIEFDEAKDAELSFGDLSGDGLTDLLAVRKKAGQTTVLVAGEGGLGDATRIRLTVPGEVRRQILTDFNGDGRPDLALPYLPQLQIPDLVRVVARGEVLIKVPIFLNRGGATCFAARADKQLTIPIRIRVSTDSAGRIKLSGLVVVEYGGDLDGDGRKDLLITRRPDLLAVHRGRAEGIFETEPGLEIAIPDCAAFDSVRSAAANLDGDAKSDIVLHYRGAGRRPDQLHVLLSAGRK